MSKAAEPTLEPGRVYRTQELSQWSANPPRLARRMVKEGRLSQLAHGLFVATRQSRFGAVPPNEEASLRAFLKDSKFVLTGPERWNALGLGATAVFAKTLVYNTKRSGTFRLGGRQFLMRRVRFPLCEPPPEWFIVDLFQHADQAGVEPARLEEALAEALRTKRFDAQRLNEMARDYGTRETQRRVHAAMAAS